MRKRIWFDSNSLRHFREQSQKYPNYLRTTAGVGPPEGLAVGMAARQLILTTYFKEKV